VKAKTYRGDSSLRNMQAGENLDLLLAEKMGWVGSVGSKKAEKEGKQPESVGAVLRDSPRNPRTGPRELETKTYSGKKSREKRRSSIY